jgi:hypothetical protein
VRFSDAMRRWPLLGVRGWTRISGSGDVFHIDNRKRIRSGRECDRWGTARRRGRLGKDRSKVSQRVVGSNGRRHAQMLQRVKRVHGERARAGRRARSRETRQEAESQLESTHTRVSGVENWHTSRASLPIGGSH